MGNKFWHGLLWGGLAGSILSAMMRPMAMARTRRKPLTELSLDAVKDGTRELMYQARRTRKRLMRKMS